MVQNFLWSLIHLLSGHGDRQPSREPLTPRRASVTAATVIQTSTSACAEAGIGHA